MASVGIVIIGRNEGERLKLCLRSVAAARLPAIYVDSGSTDASVTFAREAQIEVLELDPSRPFSAARARNEGFYRLTAKYAVSYVQFLDGDCELLAGWLEHGARALDSRDTLGVVCGEVRERDPQASIYNRLCALEWIKPVGEIRGSGGNFMGRAEAFRIVGGFRAEVIAGEEDDLCLRLRGAGFSIEQLDAPMVCHDAAMTTFAAWWRRARRAGHSFAQGRALRGARNDAEFTRNCRRAWFWGLLLPLSAAMLAWPTRGWSLVLLAAYPLQILRIYRAGRQRGWSVRDARLYAFFATLSKFPTLSGILEYHRRSWRGASFTIIEHKLPG